MINNHPNTPPPAVVRRRLGLRTVTAAVLALLASVGLALSGQTAAHADTGLTSIVCGGEKFGPGWQTYDTGGVTSGEGGCAPGIDYLSSRDAVTEVVYDFGIGDANYHYFQAWIPTVHATVPDVEFDLFADPTSAQPTGCPGFVGVTQINEAPVSGWQNLFDYDGFNAGYPGCEITIRVWAGSGYGYPNEGDLGLDAIRSHD